MQTVLKTVQYGSSQIYYAKLLLRDEYWFSLAIVYLISDNSSESSIAEYQLRLWNSFLTDDSATISTFEASNLSSITIKRDSSRVIFIGRNFTQAASFESLRPFFARIVTSLDSLCES